MLCLELGIVRHGLITILLYDFVALKLFRIINLSLSLDDLLSLLYLGLILVVN